MIIYKEPDAVTMTAIVQIGDAIINANTLTCDFQTITHAMTQQSCAKKKRATQLQLKHSSFTMVMVYVEYEAVSFK